MTLSRADVPCGSCRLCCKGEVVMLLPEEGDVVAAYETEPVALPGGGAGHQLKRRPNGDCVYLGEQGCTIHDRAPAICRVFDCRRWYLSHTRAERRMMVAKGMATKDIFEAGRERLNTLGRSAA